MNTRLLQFLNAENITQAQFADSIKVARAGVSHIIAGRNKPSWDFIVNTMNRYPDLNIEWLITGKGKMYKSPARSDSSVSSNDSPSRPNSAASAQSPAAPSSKDEDSLLEFDEVSELGNFIEHIPAGARHGIVLPKPGQNSDSAPSDVDTPLPFQNQPFADENKAVQPEAKVVRILDPQPVKQRKVTKVIIFFDDGTFQER